MFARYFVGSLAMLATAGPALTHAAPPAPIVTLAARGQIADAFALSPDGARIAYVELTLDDDGEWAGSLRIASLPAGTEVSSVAGVPVRPTALHWAGPDRIVIVEGKGARQVARVVPIQGPAPERKLGPADGIGVATVEGTPAVITYRKVVKRGLTAHVLASHAASDLRPLRAATLTERNGRLIHRGIDLRPLWWTHGFSVLVARKVGGYDKVEDVELPERLARLDVLGDQLTDEELTLAGFARVTAEHRARPGHENLVFRGSGDFQLVTHGRARPLRLGRKASAYQQGSLHFQTLEGDQLLVSATSLRTTAEPDAVELYLVSPSAGGARQLLVVPGLQRLVRWHAAGGRVGVLQLRDGAMGGPAIQVFALPSGPASAG